MTQRSPEPMTRDIVSALRDRGVANVDSTSRRRAEYSSDASNYRVVPEVVVFPRDADEIVAIVDAARATATPLTMRGGGTSVAGNAIGTGIVVDTSRYFGRVLSVDPDARLAVVEPGALLGDIQAQAGRHGLRFGPDPSTWARCTIGGMIGNNACGPRALAFGRTADNVAELEVVDGRGRRFAAGTRLDVIPGLDALVSGNLATLRTELGRFERQLSGYSLEHLLPERGHNLAKALVGTEGSCVAILKATIRLVDVPRDPLLVVLGYEDMPAAADATMALLPLRPMAIEGLDARIVDAVRRNRGASAVPDLPPGGGWLLIEVADIQPGDAGARAADMVAASGALGSRIIPTGPEAKAIWRIREDGAGLAGRTASGHQAWPGIEDAAVPPAALGAYLREFDALTERYGITGIPYGHFGDGCVHVRLDIPLEHDGTVLRLFMEDVAALIARHGGSLSGEHGDGRARGELLHTMYSDTMLGVFSTFKGLFDPLNVMNPGIGVRPALLDADLRRPAALQLSRPQGLALAHDAGDFTAAVHRCVGVGKCRADNSASGGFMCPSYLATKDEKDSTRGRARVLQEMLNGTLVKDGWRSPEVHDALDLCLSCKACGSDCPAGVDMAAYKTEVLHQTYRGRLRPVSHYALGWMPRWARLGSRLSVIANALLAIRPLEILVLLGGGMDTRRSIPRFARRSFSASARRSGRPPTVVPTARRVVLWVDSFSDNFSPDVVEAMLTVLRDAGYDVSIPDQSACCGLTWITTGQLEGARRKLRDLVDVLGPYVDEGALIVGVEPSCTAVLRSDLPELLPDDERAARVSAATRTLSELLMSEGPDGPDPGWKRPDLSGVEVLVQPHCHHHSVMGFTADKRLLSEFGAVSTVLGGCCGLAGNFGMERGHYETSVAVAENSLLPALRKGEYQVFLADGLSCRVQAEQLGGVHGLHLAQLLRQHLAVAAPGQRGE